MKAKVSVIIPSKNGGKYLAKTIEAIKRLDHGNFELIIVDDGSSDDTQDILNRFKDIKVITTTGIGPSAARNLALKEASGEYIAFTDADCIVHPQWLNELLKGYGPASVVSVGGDQQSPQDETKFGRKVQEFLKSVGFTADYVKNSEQIVQTKHNPTCNVMYKKDALMDVDGFLEGLWPGEDLELDHKLIHKGYKLYFNPKAIVYHYRPDTFSRFIKMMFNYGRAQGFLVKKFGPFRFIHYVPVVLAAVLGLCIGSGSKTSIAIAVISCITAYAYFVLKTKGLFKASYFVWMLINTILFWNAGFLQELIAGRYKVKNTLREAAKI
jgi:glycosyltransferase involved in cell wall biosynthesis